MTSTSAKRGRSLSRTHTRRLALLFVTTTLLLSPPAGPAFTLDDRRMTAAAPPDASARQLTTKVVEIPRRRTLYVSVTDEKGWFATGLEKSRFTVYDHGSPRDVVSFVMPDAPLSIGIIMDASGSMDDPFSEQDERGKLFVKAAVSKFLERSRPDNEYFVIGFNQRPQMLLDRTRDPEAVLATFDALAARDFRGITALYDACYLGLDKVTYGAHPKRVLLVITDGADNASKYKLGELVRLAKEQDVLIYAIGLVSRQDFITQQMKAVLDELAWVSGGMAYYAGTGAELMDAAERIALGLRLQYSLGVEFAPSPKKDGWHRLEVKVTPMRDAKTKKLVKLYAQTRKGFYDASGAR